MGKKRRKVRKTNKKNRKRQKRLPLPLLVLITLILGITVLFSAREAFFYITESGYDPENPYPVKGIDVSMYQGDINWKGLKSEDIAFAFIKATEGSSYTDPDFEKNWKEAHSAGIAAGAYHFMSFDTDAKSQTENFINTVPKKRSALPPVVDVELYGNYVSAAPPVTRIRTQLDGILAGLEAHYGRKPIIYTNTHIYSTCIAGRYDDYAIWISDSKMPAELPDGREWKFCQYTFKGISENISEGEKYVDFNVFNGTKWQFRKYRRNPGSGS